MTQPRVLVVDDEPASVGLLRITLGQEFEVHVATGGDAALALLAEHPDMAVAVVDQRMPGMTGTEVLRRTSGTHPHLVRIILTGYSDIEALIAAVNEGRVYRYLTKPWNRDELVATVRQAAELHDLTVANVRMQAELAAANARLRVENAGLQREARGKYRFADLVGTSAALRRMLDLVERAVLTDTTVLVTGETGTGKELVARAIHYNGLRRDRAFVTENCGAIASDLLSSELFGHKRGAFTGALEDRKGLFETAQGGTLFLDEIGDCPAELQTRLLRVLDQREIRRVGDTKPIPVDVRIITATHRDLEREAEAGAFRRDLYYRLSVFTIVTPPLRERKEDIPLIATRALERLNGVYERGVTGFTPEALARLAAYDFPGNVRELQNEVERAYALADRDACITPDLLSPRYAALDPLAPEAGHTLRAALDRAEAEHIREILRRNGGHQGRTAEMLGISRRGLIDKLNKYGLR
ncbi:MAG: sigma-54-dependent Fis family transcriptional regulator [Deltaproteobacteria bacterium]|nr:sigma-54-dependent Fis family transcriptional regulator [Deltaproteobacteria bacterium]